MSPYLSNPKWANGFRTIKLLLSFYSQHIYSNILWHTCGWPSFWLEHELLSRESCLLCVSSKIPYLWSPNFPQLWISLYSFCLAIPKFFKYKFIYFNLRLITLQYCIGFAIHQHESATGVHVFPILNPPPTSLPIPSLWVVPVHQPQASCILHRTWTGNSFLIWYYTCFNVILPSHPPPPSPTESKRLFYTSVSLLLSRIQGYRYHLSKFHMYVLAYCIGVFLSGLLHSV